MFYAPGLIGYSAVKIASPTFYSLRDSRTPVIVSVLTVAINLVLNITLVRVLGYRGLALGTALAAIFNAGRAALAAPRGGSAVSTDGGSAVARSEDPRGLDRDGRRGVAGRIGSCSACCPTRPSSWKHIDVYLLGQARWLAIAAGVRRPDRRRRGCSGSRSSTRPRRGCCGGSSPRTGTR